MDSLEKGLREPLHSIFICLYFIGVGGDEKLKNYLVWPYGPIEIFAGRTSHVVVVVVHRLIFKLR